MAATILEIKSKAIIPNEEAQLEAEEEGRLLISRLEEYKLYKESAEKLKNLDEFIVGAKCEQILSKIFL